MSKLLFSVIIPAFIMGILAAEFTNIPFTIFWIISLTSIALSAIFLKRKKQFLFFLILAAAFSGGAHLKNSQSLPYNHISNFTPYKSARARIEGIIKTDPSVNSRFSSFIFTAERFVRDGRRDRVCGDIFVKVFGKRKFSYGDRLFIEGRLYRPPYFRISKRLNYRNYLKQRQIYSILSVDKNSIVKVREKDRGNYVKKLAFWMKHRMERIIINNMPPLPASILSAIILGERSNLPKNIRKIMVQSGTVHIIAISGLHVGLISFIILMFLRILRMPRKLSYIITVFILVIYCLLTGARTPVVRVTIMAVMIFFGYIIGRPVNIYNTLLLAAFLILAFNPRELFSVSFQLSFVSVISIVWLAPKIKALFPDGGRKHLRNLITLFSGSLAAWIGLLPFTAYYFNIISPVAIFANMVVIPYLSIVIGSGLLFVLLGLIFPSLGYLFGAACEASIVLLIKLISVLVRIPGAYFYLP